MKRLLTLLCLISTCQVLAGQGDTYYDNVGWAQGAQQSTPGRAQGKLNVDDYCADAACKQQVRNPNEAQLNDGNMDTKKQTQFVSNEHANAVQGSFDKGRPEVSNDPAYEFALIAQDNAYEITHGISNQYVDCNNGTNCTIDYIPKVCRQPTNNNVPCTKSPVFTVITSPVIYNCPSGWTRNGHTCNRTIKQCRYDSSNYAKVTRGSCSRSPQFVWNGQFIRPPFTGLIKGDFIRSRSFGGCKGRTTVSTYQICGPVPQSQRATLSCRSGYTLSGGNCIKNRVSWKTHCTLLSECKVTSQRCIEGRATRYINGIPTTLDCWKYQVNHQCERANTCNALPADCTTTATHCSAQQKGVCIEEELNKSCPQKRCSSTDLVCGEESFCLDGDCYGEMPTPSDDFNESAAALAALAKAAEGLGDPPLIFSGQGQKCSKKMGGFADCCKNGGWGTDAGLAQCSDDEKALGQAKEKKLTIYLGSYCAKKVLGKCIRKKKAYCVFDNLLARIIQEQGVQNQLGLSLGTARNPVCGAITPEQMQHINFADIDFSDFFGEMHSNTNLPSGQEIQNRLSSGLGGQ
ncbi:MULTISPECIES: type-F conjugative transfer system mating-pair stabilization protein TraN [Vibrio]|uniref:type-F conjugative transfer system mating-pair stabilization protein TraN n=1 Tax=Vibrio TaxID=662 RepID=UPI0002E2944D|nr:MULTISPECIES: type-F conjugative transfer system mating-pair stabilization protein TraN [Vibrio]OCH57665.1 type-F conjugative transfer system mating-pair stabilization protein TraN [Vibrio lentus]